MLTDALKDTIQRAYRQYLESRGLKPRYGQRLMIAEIVKTLARVETDEDGHRTGDTPVCAVEAGTGTGKTVAYSLAVLPVARALDKKVVISTATIALQEQIVLKDLPDLQRNSGLNFSFALAKGRGRYLCLSKLDQLLSQSEPANPTLALYPDEMPVVQDAQVLKLYGSMAEALGAGKWDGDRDAWRDTLEDGHWSPLTSDHAQCTGRRCSNIAQCSFYRAREDLAKVDCIVANHDLVLADLALGGGAILPPPEDAIYIFDEGHHLPDKALRHFAQHARLRASDRWLEQVGRMALQMEKGFPGELALVSVLQTLPPLAQELRQFSGRAIAMLEDIAEPEDDGELGPHVRFPHGVVPAPLMELAGQQALLLERLEKQLDKVVERLKDILDESGPSLPRQQAEATLPAAGMALMRARELSELWCAYAEPDAEGAPPKARWLEIEERPGAPEISLNCSMISAASTLRQVLWSRCFAAVVASATLTALGRFDRFRIRAGLSEDAVCLAVPSPFDYAGRGRLIVPRMDADPSNPYAHTRAIIEQLPSLLSAEEGSLVLFSSRKQMREVSEGLPEAWRERLLVQGALSKQEVLRRHREALDSGRGSVIFGLASFAEGVDLPGQYCTHVVIAKIPFAAPDDPIESALAEWVEQRGGNPFMEITVPDAAVKLVQAAGRLLRTEQDSGRITLLDRRVVTKRYGKLILDSLPPFKREVA